jgi:hypothetical protein
MGAHIAQRYAREEDQQRHDQHADNDQRVGAVQVGDEGVVDEQAGQQPGIAQRRQQAAQADARLQVAQRRQRLVSSGHGQLLPAAAG